MAQAQLIFNLDDSSDQVAHMRAIKSLDMALTLWDMEQYLRVATKYAPDSMSSEVYGKLQDVRLKLQEIMSKHSIDIDELLK
jgi:hypothetical protein